MKNDRLSGKRKKAVAISFITMLVITLPFFLFLAPWLGIPWWLIGIAFAICVIAALTGTMLALNSLAKTKN